LSPEKRIIMAHRENPASAPITLNEKRNVGAIAQPGDAAI
jgi:hypothetical protein